MSVEGINSETVSAWLEVHIPRLALPLEFTLIAGGHSNLTYRFVDRKGAAYVLRRPPLGHVLESAHDMGREYRIITALAKSEVPVAPTFGLCEDPAVNGASFYVMGFVTGSVLHDALKNWRTRKQQCFCSLFDLLRLNVKEDDRHHRLTSTRGRIQ